MKAGDFITVQEDDGQWHTIRILAIDVWPDGSECFHCTCYEPTPERPRADALETLDVLVYHAPIDAEDFKTRWSVLHSSPPTDADMSGFFEYLKHTDFPRYIEVSGQDLSEVIALANAAYREACALGDKKQPQQAIPLYERAFDLFPLFYEAIDNRAFSFMELGDYATALAGFEHSLQVNPEGEAAIFSRGECLLKLGRLDEAEAVFLEGAQRPGGNQAMFQRFLATTKDLRKQAARGQ